jgi:hypothetical protein
MYRYSPFVVTSSVDGESRPVYGGFYTIIGNDKEYFFPYMGGHIIYGLKLHLLYRRFTITRCGMYFACLPVFRLSHMNGCVHPGYVEAGLLFK